MIYTAADGSRLTDEQAQRYGETIGMLVEEWEGATPEIVLEAAKDPASPLHDFFEWDDSEAASRYRISQAGYLLRSIHVAIKRQDGTEDTTRAFHPVTVKRVATPPAKTNGKSEPQIEVRRSYMPIQHIVADEDLREQIITRATRELASWRKQYAQYQEFTQVFNAIDVVLA